MSRSLLRSLVTVGVAASAFTLSVLPASAAPVGFTIDQQTGELASIDAGTSVIADIGGENFNIDSLALSCDGTLYGIAIGSRPDTRGVPTVANGIMDDEDALVTIDKATGAVTPVGDIGQVDGRYGLAFAPDGTLYLSRNDELYTVSTTTGATTTVGNFTDPASDMRSLAVAADGTLYGYDDESGRLFTIDPATAATTEVGASGYSMGDVLGLDFDSAGTLWAIAQTDGTGVATFDLTTGEGTFLDNPSIAAQGLALNSYACPPPPSTTTTSTSTTAPTTSTTARPQAAAAAVVAQPRFTG